jgi:Zn-dependent peptidase ImmA (M78 family)
MSIRGGIRRRENPGEKLILGDLPSIVEDSRQKGYYVDDRADIERIITNQGIKIIKEKLPANISGYLKKGADGWIIGVNSLHHPKRQRFTIAHEFAHYCLHKNEAEGFEDTTFFRKENDSSIEYNANDFASEILMPKERFIKLVESGITSIIKLSEIFDVSTLAVKYRANSLNLNLSSND